MMIINLNTKSSLQLFAQTDAATEHGLNNSNIAQLKIITLLSFTAAPPLKEDGMLFLFEDAYYSLFF